MRESINGHAIFNNNQMTRQVDTRPVLLVESDADQSIIRPHLLRAVVRCAPGFSKSATLQAAELHDANGDTWAMALVDQDLGQESIPANAVTTAFYDLEAEIFFVHGDRVGWTVFRHLVSEKIDSDEAERRRDIVMSASENLAETIGIMKRYAHTNGLAISFSQMPISEVFRRASDSDIVNEVASLACQRASNASSSSALIRVANEVLASGEDSRQLCSGHDLMIAMCVLIGRHSKHRPNVRDFSRGVHGVIGCPEMRLLSVYEPVNNWLRDLLESEAWDCVA